MKMSSKELVKITSSQQLTAFRLSTLPREFHCLSQIPLAASSAWQLPRMVLKRFYFFNWVPLPTFQVDFINWPDTNQAYLY